MTSAEKLLEILTAETAVLDPDDADNLAVVIQAGLPEVNWACQRNEPQPGRQYRLTGDRQTPSVMRGDDLADCEV